MVRQFVKTFKMMTVSPDPISIDTQINQFLEDNPDYKIASVSYSCSAGVYEKALVVFDHLLPKNNTPPKMPESKKQSEYSKK